MGVKNYKEKISIPFILFFRGEKKMYLGTREH